MKDEDASIRLERQVSTWNQMAQLYAAENAPRLAAVADRVIVHAGPKEGDHVLDVGTGTGTVVKQVAAHLGERGEVVGIDISPEMLAVAERQLVSAGPARIRFVEGGAELIPAADSTFDIVLACLSLMYVPDRAVAAREISRVLRPGGCFVGAVWAKAEQCDLVRFQEMAGTYAAAPPIPGVGPGVLADPDPFLQQLSESGIDATVEIETLGFEVDSFALAWKIFAGVTAAKLSPERQQEAKDGILAAMWPNGDGPRHFRNTTQFIVGKKARYSA